MQIHWATLQAEQNLPVTGVIDSKTWKELGRLNGIIVDVTSASSSNPRAGKVVPEWYNESMKFDKNNKNMILLAVGAVSILGLGWFLMTRR